MGYSDLGCFGSEIKTPNLDRLAEQGCHEQIKNRGNYLPTTAETVTRDSFGGY